VGEFNGGKNLSLITSSVLEKDPDLPEAHRYIKADSKTIYCVYILLTS